MLLVIGLAQTSLFKVCAIATRIAGFLNAALTMVAFLGNLTYDSRSCPPLALAMVSSCSAGTLRNFNYFARSDADHERYIQPVSLVDAFSPYGQSE